MPLVFILIGLTGLAIIWPFLWFVYILFIGMALLQR